VPVGHQRGVDGARLRTSSNWESVARSCGRDLMAFLLWGVRARTRARTAGTVREAAPPPPHGAPRPWGSHRRDACGEVAGARPRPRLAAPGPKYAQPGGAAAARRE
jgi:hypothetical protein